MSRKATALTPGRSSSIFGESSPLTKGKTGSRSSERTSSVSPGRSGTYYEASYSSLRRSYSPTNPLNYASSSRTPGRYPSTPTTPGRTPGSPVTRGPTPPQPPSPPPGNAVFPGAIAGSYGDRYGGRLRSTRWARTNPVADIPYLSRGLGGNKQTRKKGKRKDLFGGSPF